MRIRRVWLVHEIYQHINVVYYILNIKFNIVMLCVVNRRSNHSCEEKATVSLSQKKNNFKRYG